MYRHIKQGFLFGHCCCGIKGLRYLKFKMMSTEINFSEATKSLLKRHETKTGKVGMNAVEDFDNMRFRDASENRFAEGEEIFIPKDVKNYIVSDVFNGVSIGSIACVNGAGKAKLLPLGSLTKTVPEYEQNADGTFAPRHDKNGQPITHNADDGEESGENQLRQLMLGTGTMTEAVEALAGKTLKVAKVLGPYKTARWSNHKLSDGTNDRVIVGLRPTSVNVYEEVKEAKPAKAKAEAEPAAE